MLSYAVPRTSGPLSSRTGSAAGRSIFFYTDSRMLGGAEQALLTLIEALDLDAWRPTLLLDDLPETQALAQPADALGIPVKLVPPTPLGLVGARRVPSLVRLLRRERPDVFHAHLSWPLAAKYALVAAVAARVPAVVATVHLIPEFTLDRSNFLQLFVLSRGVGRYIAVSRDIATQLSARFRWPGDKIKVIYNAVPAERFEVPASPKLAASLANGRLRPIVLTCARLDPQKGHAVLLQAAARVTEAVFILAGEGPLRSALEMQAARLGITERVRFLGFRTDIPQLLAVSDVFVLPSLYEGTPLAVLEAMSAARAIVSSAIGGIGEVIEDGQSGMLTAPGDVDGLVAALRRLLSDQALRDRLGRRARERAIREFTPDAMARSVTDVYANLLGRANPAPPA